MGTYISCGSSKAESEMKDAGDSQLKLLALLQDYCQRSESVATGI